MSVLQSSISGPELSDKEIVVDEVNTFDMDENEGVMVPEERNAREFDEAGSDDSPFVADIADILSSVAPVMVDSTLLS